ncbi:pirin family protein [Allopusillimonas ginsengisoli]|uniref:pirin family protein n=1 Tax=Allopusillimonas ginsengisoli TaxID=453575 RepID=UPI001020A3FD|nr:pirin family protein [Allopusillimonas ginsengisoli]TEA77590.1 pirin family protein [Allopusillimonas ginsengisoli]
MADQLNDDHPLEVVVVPRTHDLGDQFEVRRALPSRERRMVGPFVFLDQMGPHVFSAGKGLDVRPHPHIGLATVTYLFDGEILHHDSLGSLQTIQPGDVNWMTAGKGIVHSERTAPETRQSGSALFGMQCWVALPEAHEEDEPDFLHVGKSSLPVEEGEGVSARIIAGCFLGHRSPAPILSDLFQADVMLAPGATLQMPAEYPEQAIYVAQGVLDIGRNERYDAGQLLVLKPGKSVTLTAAGPTSTRLMLFGGAPMESSRYLSWNFVSSSADRIEQAKEDWKAGRFPKVPGESDFIPLPDIPGKPVRYP